MAVTLPEKVTVTVEDPDVLTVPVQISRSCPAYPEYGPTTRVQVPTPPPETDETVTVDESALTARTRRSPECCGDTASEVVPVAALNPRAPTAVMVPGGVVTV